MHRIRSYNKSRKWVCFALILGIMMGCRKKNDVFPDPYAGAKQALGIQMSTDPPSPADGSYGSTVYFKATGLMHYKDSLHFFLNSVEAPIVSVDSGGIKVKVPPNASTGVGSLTLGDEIFFGPVFRVDGHVEIDNNFKATIGANGSVNDVLQLPAGRLIFVGGFSDFNHKGVVKPLNRIVLTSKDGAVDLSFEAGTGADGHLNNIAALANGKLVVAGGFSSFNNHLGQINNVTLLNANGSLDTMIVPTFLNQDTVPVFNGGTDGNIQKTFVYNNTITAIGRFNYYLTRKYDIPDYLHIRDSLVTDSVRVHNMIRFFADGSLDSSFNYNFQRHRGKEGPNGPIADAYMQDDGKLIIVGKFTSYNGQQVNNIVRLNTDGSIDRSFLIGGGADNAITSIKYNENTKKFILAGNFDHFNGQARSGLVLLNPDGTVDGDFIPAPKNPGDLYFYAQQLSNQMVLVSGFFQKYNNIQRTGIMVLDNKGNLVPGYNNMGNFNGFIFNVLETKNSSGQITALLMGAFDKFDEQSVGNVTRLVFQ
ncbi:MAG: DUF5008 domain-containing protein [Chitinophagaceae bacterium]|nr:MAG: DUF5008 domain-containing protein [Chitinophagaceae bacterium]